MSLPGCCKPSRRWASTPKLLPVAAPMPVLWWSLQVPASGVPVSSRPSLPRAVQPSQVQRFPQRCQRLLSSRQV